MNSLVKTTPTQNELVKHFGKGYWKTYSEGIQREWVITNGLGGYCGSSIIDSPTRKHHGLLIASLRSPVKRYLILSKLNDTLTIGDNIYPLYTTKYNDRIVNGFKQLQRFSYATFPIYTYQVENVWITKELYMPYGKNATLIKINVRNGDSKSSLRYTPQFNIRPHGDQSTVKEQIYTVENFQKNNNIYLLSPSTENIHIKYRYNIGSSTLFNSPIFDESIYLDTEFATGMNGYDTTCGLFEHGIQLEPFESKTLYIYCEVITENHAFYDDDVSQSNFESFCEQIIANYKNRIDSLISTAQLESPLAKALVVASDQFISKRQSTGLKTILAGLPWFSDWARDTMIALLGTTLSTKQYKTCKEILQSFAKYEKNGIIPNMFPDEGSEPLYNTVDGPLWYFHAVYEYFLATKDKDLVSELYDVLSTIIKAFKNGTDFSIHMDKDGLIHAGSGLDQVTWMDVRINGVVVTPRHGKPVEINALWYNALKIMDYFSHLLSKSDSSYNELSQHVKTSFNTKFWNEEKQCLYDVVDQTDDSIRSNQIWAISLPFTMLPPDKEKQVVNTVYKKLYATYGLRSLSPENSEYKPFYKGELIDRDFAYHQGTVWTFPLGGFITAYSKCYQDSPTLHEEIMSFIEPFEDHLRDGCIGSIAEIFDGDSPHISRGCYAQAWSVGEILRVLADEELRTKSC